MTTAGSLVAGYVVARHPRDEWRHRVASRAFLDTVTAAFAGRDEASARAARASASMTLAARGAPEAREWATGTRLPVAEAAFVNGVAAHALDLDDVSMAMWGHPSTLLVPVAVSLGEAVSATVGDVLHAYVIGLHVDVALAAAFDLADHYARGWHASVTIGTLGAVATAARLLGLNADQTRNALGLGVSMASGSRQNFGTMTKALHIGLAAANAVRATQLAAWGVDASAEAIDGPLGFYSLYGSGAGGGADIQASLASPEAASLSSLNVKRYPCCYQTHRAIDATLDLRDQLGVLAPADIEDVIVQVNPGSDNSLIHPYATTPTEGRFCMRYVVAAALLRGRVDFASFTEHEVNDPESQALMHRIRLRHAESPPGDRVPPARDYATVLVRRRGAEERGVTCLAPRGGAERPLSDKELLDKADNCLEHAGVRADARGVFDVLDAPSQPVTRLVDVLGELRRGHDEQPH